MSIQKPVSCLRCARVLLQNESRCAICAAQDQQESKQKAVELEKKENEPIQSKADVFLGSVGILLFLTVPITMGIGFLQEMEENGISSAIKNRPGILWIIGVVAIVLILASRDTLERVGLGGLHKIVRRTVLTVITVIAIILTLSIIGNITSCDTPHGLPDNIRN